MTDTQPANTGPLVGIRILDLSRILAGPTCTQLLGDLGADVIKIENPASGGDDTRQWGPPFVIDEDGNATTESAYYLCANRNKRSIEIDIRSEQGQQTVREIAATCDVIVENFKAGALSKYELGYEDLKQQFPGIVYCSISGYGHTGPNASKPGYDIMAQGYGGIMSITGDPAGEPMKVGVGIADVMCGMYASVGILAALRHRDNTGQGQHIDLALVDSQVAWLANEGTNYLLSGNNPIRRGNGHPNIVPYQVYGTSDGYVIIAVGNDGQFSRFCQWLEKPELAQDPRFNTNPERLKHRDELNAVLEPLLKNYTIDTVIRGLEECGVPVGPVNTLDRVFDSDQVSARNMKISVPHSMSGSGSVDLIGNPLNFSLTPITYRHAPPHCGEHTEEILNELRQSKNN